MSIHISNLNKYYGAQHVIKNVSLNISSGGVTGLLGPNGAGKSTMMKILSGIISPSAGSASVCGLDVVSNSREVKKIIGYLPENNPLYFDMYVKEFLNMTCDIYNVKNKTQSVKNVMERTGLMLEKHKRIGQLSKGYKQRVGLAQNLLHNPEVLILDEPTTGLDPNQLAEIRKLIKEIGKEKTVILSSHIMQEVEAVCDRVVIINKGEIVADGNTDNLKLQSTGKNVEIAFAENVSDNLFAETDFADCLSKNKNSGMFLVKGRNDNDIRPLLFKLAIEKNITIIHMVEKELSLEDIFKQLTT